MKLQTRIIIGFLMVILVPLLLFMATLIGFGYFQANQGNGVRSADTAYDLSIAESDGSTARVQLMTKDVLFMILVILVFTSVTVGSWLYRSVAVPW